MDEKLKKLKDILKGYESKLTRTFIRTSFSSGVYCVSVEIEKLKEYYEYDKLPRYKKIYYSEYLWEFNNYISKTKYFESLQSFDKPLDDAIIYFSQNKPLS